MRTNIPRFMISAPNSGSGKTTITCALLRALMDRGLEPAAYKAGPDYIDPMFHGKVTGAESRNLDVYMLGESTCRALLAKNSLQKDVAVLEGVMGYYDGIGTAIDGSAYELAKLTGTPVILAIDVKGASLSLAALINGFRDFRKDSNIIGVILNNTGSKGYLHYKKIIEKECGLKVFGHMPKVDGCSFASRHLGLITADEIKNLQEIIGRLASQADKTIDVEGILEAARKAPELCWEELETKYVGKVTIAVAKDNAFCFYYQDSLDLLRKMGANIIFFSPLSDKALPACQGLLLGGGYPELYAEELARNQEMLQSIGRELSDGLPCIAECGGYMYLHRTFKDKEGRSWKWVGAIPGTVTMTEGLNHFGYMSLEALEDNVLTNRGGSIRAHEFHYSESDCEGNAYIAKKADGRDAWRCTYATKSLHAGYPHMHLCGNPDFAANFIRACRKRL